MIRYRLLDRCGNVVHDSTNLDLAMAVSRMWSFGGFEMALYTYESKTIKQRG